MSILSQPRPLSRYKILIFHVILETINAFSQHNSWKFNVNIKFLDFTRVGWIKRIQFEVLVCIHFDLHFDDSRGIWGQGSRPHPSLLIFVLKRKEKKFKKKLRGNLSWKGTHEKLYSEGEPYQISARVVRQYPVLVSFHPSF